MSRDKRLLATLAVASLALGARVRADDPAARPLTPGTAIEATLKDGNDVHHYRFEVAKRGPFALRIAPLAKEVPIKVTVGSPGSDGNGYQLELKERAYLFFPVLEKGTADLVIAETGTDVPDAKYRLTVTAHEVPKDLTEEQKKAARAAIDKGVQYLLGAEVESGDNGAAFAGLALAALSEGADAARIAQLEEKFLPRIAAARVERDVTWKGKKTFSYTELTYVHAVTTLGLCEAASAGSAKARALVGEAVEYLLAIQLTENRVAAPVTKGSPSYGGWRYAANSDSADLSVAGWCVIALSASLAANVQVPGTREALALGQAYVTTCGGPNGFNYEAHGNSDEHGDVRDGIGALLYLLDGNDEPPLDKALAHLDQHLSAWTQVEAGDGYPLYYVYYATRANYLRGGYAWNAWRSTLIQHLLENQQKDGAWQGWVTESGLGPSYATPLAILVLRLSLEQVPAYLKREVRGF